MGDGRWEGEERKAKKQSNGRERVVEEREREDEKEIFSVA